MPRYVALALLAALTGPARPAFAQQDARSQFMEGERYRVGAGVKSDPVQAREWYLKAAAQGHAPEQAGRVFARTRPRLAVYSHIAQSNGNRRRPHSRYPTRVLGTAGNRRGSNDDHHR